MSTYSIINDAVLACLKAQGLTLVRLPEASIEIDEVDPEAFAKDVAANAAMCLEGNEPEVRVFSWRPSDEVRQ